MTFRSILLLILFGAMVIAFIGKLRQGVAEANLTGRNHDLSCAGC